MISPCVGPPQPIYGHIEGSISSADLHAVSPSSCDGRGLPLSLNEGVFPGAVSFAEVHVEVFGVVVGGPAARAVDRDLSSNMASHLQHGRDPRAHGCRIKHAAWLQLSTAGFRIWVQCCQIGWFSHSLGWFWLALYWVKKDLGGWTGFGQVYHEFEIHHKSQYINNIYVNINGVP